MIIELDITKENTELISDNDTMQYIIGIGETDYTIHRDANDINEMYVDRYGFYKDMNVHNYHVFQSRIKTIAGDIKWKKSFKYNDKNYNIIDAYIGVENKCRLIYNKADFKSSIDYLTFDGLNMSAIEEKLKYVINVKGNDGI